jgi:hypothetical protein
MDAAFAPVAQRLHGWRVGPVHKDLLQVGDRRFVPGSETFVWAVFIAARQLGLGASFGE